MDYRKLSDADLADFAQNVQANAAALTGTAVAAGNLTALGTATDDLIDAVQGAILTRANAQAATEVKTQKRKDVEEMLSTIKMSLRANGNPKEDFEFLGFGALDDTKTRIIPSAPTALVVSGDSSNQNYLRWQGNNESGSVSYVIERRVGDTGAWTYVAVTKRQNFTHQGVTAGQYSEYRVKAISATAESAYSNTAVIYGV